MTESERYFNQKSGLEHDTIRIQVSKKVNIKLHKFSPAKETNPPILLLPGWITIVKKYLGCIEGLVSQGHSVYYVETREKKSSIFTPPTHSPQDFLLEHYLQDIKVIIKKIELTEKPFFIYSSSFGAGLTTKYMAKNDMDQYIPERSLMVIPSTNLYFQSWQKLLIRLPLIFEEWVIKMVEWYIHKKFYNPDEPEQNYEFKANFYSFDTSKVKHSAIAIDKSGGLRLKDDIMDVINEVLVIGVENDLMHKENESKSFAALMKNGYYLNMVSNQYTNSKLMGRVASSYFMNKNYCKPLPHSIKLKNKGC